MPALAVAAVAGIAAIGAAAALEGAVIAGITISAWAAAAIGMTVGLLISTAGNMLLASMQKKPSVPDTAQDRKQAVRSGIEPHRIVYGRALVSGPVLYIGSSGDDNEFFHIVVALAGHEVEEIEEVWINDYQITLVPRGTDADGLDQAGGALGGKVIIHAFTGSDDFADPRLVAECGADWTTAHKLTGLAYVYVRIEYDQDRFPSGFSSISAIVKGKKVYDPRSETTAWSDNAALCIHDYLTSEYGLGCSSDEIDLTYMQAAANICDETVWLDSEETLSQARYTINGSFKLDQVPIEVMEGLLSACGGTLVYIQGTYRLHVAAYDEPAETITPSSFAGPLRVQTKLPRRELFNTVDGTYINPDQKWSAVSFPRVSVSEFVAEDGETISRDAEFPFTNDRSAVQRLARIQLLIARRPITLEGTFKYQNIKFACWDTVAVTLADFGWEDKVFRIRSWKYDPISGLVTMKLQEEYSTNYSWTYLDAGPDLSTPNPTTLVNPLDIPAPTGLTITATSALNGDGGTVPALEITWTNGAHPFVTSTEIQWKPEGASEWSSRETARPANFMIISPVISGVTYQVRARSVAGLVRSAWTSTGTGEGTYDSTDPGVPTDVNVVAYKNGVNIYWTRPSDRDLAAVEVWENSTSSSTGRYYIGEGKNNHFRSNMGGNVTLYFWLRSRDLTGNYSSFVGPYSGTSQGFGSADFASTISPVGIYHGVPTGALAGIDVIVNDIDRKLYKWNGSDWKLVIDQGLTNVVEAAMILANEAWFDHLTAGIATFGGLRATELVADDVVITNSLQVGGSIINGSHVESNAVTKLYSDKASDSITVYGATTYTAISLAVAVPDTASRVLIHGMIDLSQSGTLPGGSGTSGDSGNGSGEGSE